MNVSGDRGRLFRAMASAGLVAASLSSCATPSPIRAEVPGGERADARQALLISSSDSLVGDPVPAQWWSLFHDPTLTALQRRALDQNLDLQSAAARVEAAAARSGLVRAGRLPGLAAEASYTRGSLSEQSPMVALGAPSTPTNNWTAGYRATWELDLWRHQRNLENAAILRVEGGGWQREAIATSLSADIAQAYLQLRGTQAKQLLSKRNESIAQDLVKLTQSRFDNGVATSFEVHAAASALEDVRASMVSLDRTQLDLMNALALLLADTPRALDAQLSAAPFPILPQKISVGIPSQVALARPDIKRADAELRAALADVAAAKADFYPRVTLGADAGIEAFNFDDLGRSGSTGFSVGPSFHIPIFQGGRLTSNLRLTEARHREAAIEYRKAVLTAWHEVDDALTNYTHELRRNDHLARSQESGEKALGVARRSFQAGNADMITVLDAQRTAVANDLRLADSNTECALAVVALYRSLGGGWDDTMSTAPSDTGSAP